MVITVRLVCYVAAALMFFFAAVGVKSRVSWRDAGFLFLTLSLFL